MLLSRGEAGIKPDLIKFNIECGSIASTVAYSQLVYLRTVYDLLLVVADVRNY